jgi:hypothetical protein
MKFFRRTSRYTLFDHKRNEDILEELIVELVDEKLRRYKSNCLQHVRGINNNRMPKIMLNYKPNERRRMGRPLNGLLDEPGRGLSRLNSRHLMMIYHINN